MDSYSDYIVYVDESGDHGLESIDPNYPVFVLAFCIFRKDDYAGLISPAVQRFKFKYFGHDMVVLHERDIRKERGDFNILLNKEIRNSFMTDITRLIDDAPFHVFTAFIDKIQLKKQVGEDENPYHLALGIGLHGVLEHLRSVGQLDRKTWVVVESRGKKEDKDLELEFLRVLQGANMAGEKFPLQMVFADKKSNSSGLQLADLVARPIGRYVLKPDQTNRAWDVIKKKFRMGKMVGVSTDGSRLFALE